MQVKIPHVLCLLECYRSDLLGIPRRRFPALLSSAYPPETLACSRDGFWRSLQLPAMPHALIAMNSGWADGPGAGGCQRTGRGGCSSSVQIKPRLLAGAEKADCGAKAGSICIRSPATSQESQGCCSNFALSTQETRRSLKTLLKSDFCLHTGQADLTV